MTSLAIFWRCYSPFIAHMDSCARPLSSPSPRFLGLHVGSLQVVIRPCWKVALPDIIPAVFTQVLGPIPRRVHQVLLSISSLMISASRHSEHVRHIKTFPVMQFQQGFCISGLQSFVYLLAPMFARPPDYTHRTLSRGGQALYTTHSLLGYPRKMWHRYVSVMDNSHGWTFTS